MIKGIFVLLVFASHVSQYLDLSDSAGFLTQSYKFLRRNIGQLVVVPFLFYSGYGLCRSIEKKGKAYLRSLPRQRILKVYLHTVIFVTLFLAVGLLLGARYSPAHILGGYLFWTSFGNSNWYIFAILLLYLFTWASFSLLRTRRAALLCCFVLTAAYCVILSRLTSNFWYDTVFVFWFGLLYPSLQPLLHRFPGKSLLKWLGSLLLLGAVVLVLTRGISGIPHSIQENLRAILTMLLINLLLERVEVGNRVLQWFGTHVFEFYMLQRLPMILLDHFGVSKTSVPLFICASAAGTVLLVLLFSKLMERLDRLVFCSKPGVVA